MVELPRPKYKTNYDFDYSSAAFSENHDWSQEEHEETKESENQTTPRDSTSASTLKSERKTRILSNLKPKGTKISIKKASL